MLTHAARTERRKAMAEAVRKSDDPSEAILLVAREFEVSEQTVRNACRIYGVETASLASGRAVSLDVVRDLVAAALGDSEDTHEAIAERHGVSRQRVTELARRVGVPGRLATRKRQTAEATA